MTAFSLSGLKLTLPDALLTEPIQNMIDNGWYEIEEMRALNRHLRTEDRFLEIGGGMGFIAALSARKVSPERVTTVEANPDMIPVIKKNLADNGFEAAEVIHAVVVPEVKDQTAQFFLPRSFWAASVTADGMEEAHREVTVPAISLADLLEEKKPTVLMVDAEGAETNFFTTKLPEVLRQIILELHPDKYPASSIQKIFRRLDQNGFVYQPNGSQGAVVCFERISQ